MGVGCGKRLGSLKFVCKRDFAAFVPLETVIPEKDFDGYFGEAAGGRLSFFSLSQFPLPSKSPLLGL